MRKSFRNILLGTSLLSFGAISVQAQSSNLPVEVVPEVKHDLSIPLRDMPPKPLKATREEKPIRLLPPRQLNPREEDAALQRNIIRPLAPATMLNFAGVGQGSYGYSVTGEPPDTNGAVGLNQYVQWVNTSFAVFSKTGTLISGPTAGNTLWSGFGGPVKPTTMATR